jgi:hypothetical protein
VVSATRPCQPARRSAQRHSRGLAVHVGRAICRGLSGSTARAAPAPSTMAGSRSGVV